MEFDLSAVETATLVFIGTLVFALALVLFVTVAAMALMSVMSAAQRKV